MATTCQIANRRYAAEFTAVLITYMLVLFASVSLLGYYRDTTWRYLLAVAPVVPAMGVLIAFLRYFRRIDELERRIHLEALAFGFAGSAVTTFAYGFLEGVGFPHLNWTFVWPVMGIFWMIGSVMARRRYR